MESRLAASGSIPSARRVASGGGPRDRTLWRRLGRTSEPPVARRAHGPTRDPTGALAWPGAPRGGNGSAAVKGCSQPDGLAQKLFDVRQPPGGGQRADLGPLVGRVADRQLPCAPNEARQKRLVDLAGNVDPLDGAPRLTGSG